ncbi:SRPBCC family protein [Oricola sp.]|uniref:SRPBCC family protein n=1 Tax=Oricola sp. TaxID=1979950 RepID=UPI003BAB1EAF
MTSLPTYVLERKFNAPPQLVWKTWTDPQLLPRWYGPNVESVVHRIDAVPGGLWLHEMRWGGNSNFQRAEYLEVSEPERLVFVQSSADADWNIIDNPMMPGWPRMMRTEVVLTEEAGGTAMRLTWSPHEASDAEIAAFAGSMEGAGKGWGSGMDLLEALLAELQA